MSGALETDTGLRIPESLKQQLLAYRSRVWLIKSIEAIAIVVVGWAAAFLVVYCGDRFVDMPSSLRWTILALAIATVAILPWFAYRWVYCHRGLEPLARLLGTKLPAVGDQLLGVIELSRSGSEQARSPTLCQAAMRQVADDAAGRNFHDSTPNSHWRLAGMMAAVASSIALAVAVCYPAASSSALTRLTMPWKDTPRYTFTRIEKLPDEVIIAHGEPMTLPIRLSNESVWQPTTARLMIGAQPPLSADLVDDAYAFSIPPQIASQPMKVEIGDMDQTVTLAPTLRPELSGIAADVRLPDYLGQSDVRRIDSRSGSVSIVRGSHAVFTATANRDLVSGRVNEQPTTPEGQRLKTPSIDVASTPALRFQWKDQFGLSGREPFELLINAIDDEAPTLICDGLDRQSVVLDSELLKFKVQASDDFGIRSVGMSWRGFAGGAIAEPAKGERPLSAGNHDANEVEVIGTFSAKSLGIEPQPIELYVWTEDYLPGRQRVYSPPHIVYILTPDQHAIWMTEQLSKWHRQALDVRDRERQLYEKNKELRSRSAEELAGDDVRREVQRQASAEQSNGRRLERLGETGAELVRAASRNPEIGVGHLERWAEMLQVLDDLSNNRMPSVANLLSEAADAPTKIAAGPKPKGGPVAGQSRTSKPGVPAEPDKGTPPKLRSAPSLADMESSANSPDEGKVEPGPPKRPNSPSLRLPVTTVMGKAKKSGDARPNQQDAMTEAVEEQEDLLAEFDKLADELNAVLANLEGSTLVKRLKAASREQNLVAGRLTGQLQPAFGSSKTSVAAPVREVLAELKETELASVRTVSFIMDDMAAYFERRRFMHFKSVLDEMKSDDVIGGLRSLSNEVMSEQGISIAQCEYWSDTMDRWAENLVDPACSGQCPGGKSPESLPPSIVLEVLQILEAEIDLREETRVAQQAIDAVEPAEHKSAADGLSKTQAEINQRIVKVIFRIGELTDAKKHFGKELAMLDQVDRVMAEATQILKQPETGSPAIAAETEAIELLLRSKRINPKGGGGGGSSPGGGGGGNTTDSALALLGKGTNQKEVREDRGVTQTTGETGTVLPEEFRRGLDQYFNRLGGS
ncbi:hypothetical protein Poly51_51040 [Rubripirellula tenax]|uniref:Uncharacterized protein n=1 Tax=Rubripirellula tenax TaxID=2528015 RepID=A0A5C6EFQ9_9BACT|nr:hypothetical protein [Rubripirellula tenax]TWU47304.1 hypothetical protein Poly51_51040 [Rubripirellula tenax]